MTNPNTLKSPLSTESASVGQGEIDLAIYPGTVEALHSPYPEIIIDDIRFQHAGTARAGEYHMQAFISTTLEGMQNVFFVYRSKSEGDWRATPGTFGPGGNIVKGGLGSDRQYTQDTQLHPRFAEFVNAIPVASSAAEQLIDVEIPTDLEDIIADFEKSKDTYAIFDPAINDLLLKLPAGSLSYADLARTFGLERPAPEAVEQRCLQAITRLNQLLRQTEALPDFAVPSRTETSQHAILGEVWKEVFTKSIGGRPVEWHMASDAAGRVWIDRIRFADSAITPYGTDNDLVYSGLLTSKPLDYRRQTNGLPSRFRSEVNRPSSEEYTDITRFLDTLLPVQAYRDARNIIRLPDLALPLVNPPATPGSFFNTSA